MVEKLCFNCQADNTININTYKRYWHLCNECGCSSSEEKAWYSLPYLRRDYLKKNNDLDFANIYDYLISQENIQQSINEFDNFKYRYLPYIEKCFEPNSNMNILDISGGNGYFLDKFKNKNNNLVLTEINQKAIDHAKKHLDMKAIYYDVNRNDIQTVLKDSNIITKFDLIMVRACSMFVKDFNQFIKGLRDVLNEKGIIILSGNVQPTLGILMRTQFDNFSFFYLRQPEALESDFIKNNLEIIRRDWAPDLYDYYLNYYDQDLVGYAISSYYEFKAILKLGRNKSNNREKFSFRRRDRQIFYIVAKHSI